MPITQAGYKQLPESVAAAFRAGDLNAITLWQIQISESFGPGIAFTGSKDPFQDIDPFSLVPTKTPPDLYMSGKFIGDPDQFEWGATYQGMQAPQTSQPGVTVVQTVQPAEQVEYQDIFIDLVAPDEQAPAAEPGEYDDIYIDLIVPDQPQELVEQVTTQITNQLDSELEQVEQSRSQLESAILGQQTYTMDQVEPTLQRPLTRIDNQIQTMLGDAVGGAYQVGIGIPSIDQIISGEPVYSPYGIGPYMDQQRPSGGYQGTVSGGYQVPTTGQPYQTPMEPYYPDRGQAEPYQPTTPTTTDSYYSPYGTGPDKAPGACPAPVVQCPAPAPITFAPVINVNVPKDGTPEVTYKGPDDTEETSYAPECPACPEPEPCPTYEPAPEEMPEYEDEYAGVEELAEEQPAPGSAGVEQVIPSVSGEFVNPKTGGNWATTAACGFRTQPLSPFWAYELFGYKNLGTSEARAPGWIEELNQMAFAGPTLAKTFDKILVGLGGLLTSAVTQAQGEAAAATGGGMLARVISGIVSRWIGFDADYFTRGFLYDIQYHFPQTIPSESDFVQMYLGGAIDEKTLECMIRANGSYYSWYQKLARVNRTKLSVDQIISLNRRGEIGDATAAEMIRENGVTDNLDQRLYYKATEAVPTVSDIVRFMVRDADDLDVATKYGTDFGLDTKYGKQLRAWAASQGITDEVMKYYWRSHWDIPSNTALFEMYHRLRPKRAAGAVDPKVITTEKDIQDALVVNDMLPFWAQRMLAISFKPLTRTDAQRAFFIDAISEAELFDVYMDLGYQSEDARRLVRFSSQLKKKRAQSTGAVERPATTLKYFRQWIISKQEAIKRLVAGGLSEAQAAEAISTVEVQRKNESTLKCVAGIRNAYKRIAIDDYTAREQLISLGIPFENIDPLLAQWKCERATKAKYLTAAQACKLRKAEIISEEEYLARLKALGYDQVEAELVSEICQNPAFEEKKTRKAKFGARVTNAPNPGLDQAKNIIKQASQQVASE